MNRITKRRRVSPLRSRKKAKSTDTRSERPIFHRILVPSVFNKFLRDSVDRLGQFRNIETEEQLSRGILSDHDVHFVHFASWLSDSDQTDMVTYLETLAKDSTRVDRLVIVVINYNFTLTEFADTLRILKRFSKHVDVFSTPFGQDEETITRFENSLSIDCFPMVLVKQ